MAKARLEKAVYMNNKIKTLLLTSSLLSMQIPTQIQGLEAQAAQSGKAMRSKAAGATAKQVKEKLDSEK